MPSSRLLNVGLNIDDIEALNVTDVVQELERMYKKIQALRIVRSDTERTAVVQIESDVERGISLVQSEDIGRMASRLGQDCIALYAPSSGAGMLVGWNAAKWGAFNPEFFFDLSGNRLSDGGIRLAA